MQQQLPDCYKILHVATSKKCHRVYWLHFRQYTASLLPVSQHYLQALLLDFAVGHEFRALCAAVKRERTEKEKNK